MGKYLLAYDTTEGVKSVVFAEFDHKPNAEEMSKSMAKQSDTLDYSLCRSINSKFGCPPPPKEYCGQFSHLATLWPMYGDDITLSGNTWLYKQSLGISFSGWRFFSYWPVYEVSRFLLSLHDYLSEERSNDG